MTALPCRRKKKRIPQPPLHNAGRLSRVESLGSSPFARRYSGSHFCFLLLRVLRCFSSPAYLLGDYVFITGSLDITPVGFPHSESRGSKLVDSSPRRIVAFHVLLRLLVPRYPPYALCSLTYIGFLYGLLWFFFLCSCQCAFPFQGFNIPQATEALKNAVI